jgi:Rrf2 family protein
MSGHKYLDSKLELWTQGNVAEKQELGQNEAAQRLRRPKPETSSVTKNPGFGNITDSCDWNHGWFGTLSAIMEFNILRSTMFSVTSQYALRALAQLARSGNQQAMLGKDLAVKAEIPPNYLAKILLALKNAGLLGTARGSRGGYWLVRPAESIKLIEIVQLFDQMQTPQPCVIGERDQCSDENPCVAHERWRKIRTDYMDFLELTTIADLANTAKKGKVSPAGSAPESVLKTNA